MRRLEKSQERAFALRIAGDPRTASAHFAIEMCDASVWRTSDPRCHVVVYPEHSAQIQIIGIGPLGELMDFMSPMPKDTKVLMSKHQFAQMANIVQARTMRLIELYTGEAGTRMGHLPPPSPEFDIREVLYSDMPNLQMMPQESSFLFCGYKDPRDILARSAAFAAFNGVRVVSLATVEMGRTFANVHAYTVPEARGKGLATLCVASMLDRLGPTGERPLFCIPAENGSPERAMARRFSLEKAGELASVERRNLAL
jgi:GNAT superfamily N-acetyltransferase